MKILYTLTVFLFFIIVPLFGQDIHYSQFFNSPLNYNPALTGIFNGDQRISANYKHQWYSVPVPYLTFTGSYDQKFLNPRSDHFFSGGLLMNYDKAGDSRMTLWQLGLSGSYTYALNPRNLVTLGAQASLAHRSFRYGDQLSWDNQFDGIMFNPMLPSGESFDDGRQGFAYGSFGGGIHYRWQESARTHFNIGGGVYHLNKPDHVFYDDDAIDWPIRYSMHFNTSIQLNELMDIQFHGLAKFQGPAHQIVPAVLLSFYVNRQRGQEVRLDVGSMARINQDEADAIIPMIGLDVKNWYIGFSYDINVSQFRMATDRFGGPEISFQYIITHVKPLGTFKSCPIF